MSPAMFRKFVLSYLSKAIRLAHSYGLPFIKHTDGNIWKILDMMVEAGIDGLHPIEPHAGMDIGEVKRRYGDRISFFGGMSTQRTLPGASTEQVRDKTRWLCDTIGAGGGYVFSPAHDVPGDVPAENMAAMVEELKRQ